LASDPPNLIFDPFVHVTCSRHSEPFRAEYPRGFVVFTMTLLTDCFKSEEIQREARSLEEGWEDRFIALLKERPACERAEADALKRAYRTARDDWPFGVCENCGLAKKGAPYTIKHVVEKRYSHICFDCVVDFMVPANPDDR
jgi:hypothetical protein